jgi:hypothetical protein
MVSLEGHRPVARQKRVPKADGAQIPQPSPRDRIDRSRQKGQRKEHRWKDPALPPGLVCRPGLPSRPAPFERSPSVLCQIGEPLLYAFVRWRRIYARAHAEATKTAAALYIRDSRVSIKFSRMFRLQPKGRLLRTRIEQIEI